MKFLQNEFFSRKGAETPRDKSISVYQCSSVAQKAFAGGAAL